ncbi:MAG: hypothetical protein BJ554DRAFT_1660 [Olpidium bornovanus]|uniref:Uncharacterized protein n=1 Tax=Olpidium bornovanus TaxID=278681 RepID=A0A8H8DHI9_9FUNG|nr:MAG: hypothetical protein BJ554DRAFT_1660 [Olpidium bornovanus]
MSGEVADVALPASQDRKSDNQDDDKFISTFGRRMHVEAVDAALPASPKQEPGLPGLPVVAEETMKVVLRIKSGPTKGQTRDLPYPRGTLQPTELSAQFTRCPARPLKPFQPPPSNQAPQALLSIELGHPRNHNRRDEVTIGLITCCASKVGRPRVELGTFPFPEGCSTN